jgi:hypothetical protein
MMVAIVPPHILEIFTEREKRPKGSEKKQGGGRNNYELPHNSKIKCLKTTTQEGRKREQNTT